MHKDVIVKALLDSGATGIIDKRTAAKHGFKLQKFLKTNNYQKCG